MNTITYYWSDRKTEKSIRVKAVMEDNCTIYERILVTEMQKPNVTIVIRDGETRNIIFSGNYNALRTWLSTKSIKETREFSQGTQRKDFYFTAVPPIKGNR